MDRVDEDLLVLELVRKRLDDLARVDNVEDDGEEGVALEAATLAGDVLERAVGEAEILRDLLLVVSDVLLEQDLVLLLENLDDDSTQELVEGVDAVFRIDADLRMGSKKKFDGRFPGKFVSSANRLARSI